MIVSASILGLALLGLFSDWLERWTIEVSIGEMMPRFRFVKRVRHVGGAPCQNGTAWYFILPFYRWEKCFATQRYCWHKLWLCKREGRSWDKAYIRT